MRIKWAVVVFAVGRRDGVSKGKGKSAAGDLAPCISGAFRSYFRSAHRFSPNKWLLYGSSANFPRRFLGASISQTAHSRARQRIIPWPPTAALDARACADTASSYHLAFCSLHL